MNFSAGVSGQGELTEYMRRVDDKLFQDFQEREETRKIEEIRANVVALLKEGETE